MTLRIVRSGAYATVQDLGRPGHASGGVPTGGAADRVSLVLANRLVGNADGAACIEMALVGSTIAFERDAVVAFAGAAPSGVALREAILVRGGATLALGPLSGGARCYLGVAGGIDVPSVLESRCTLVSARLGGHEGRLLASGDELPVGSRPGGRLGAVDREAVGELGVAMGRRRLRVVAGPHAAALGPDALASLLASTFTVSDRSDRVGIRLNGAGVSLRGSSAGEMITEPMTPGAIQVPPDGSPIVLGPDAPVTGGYPVVASVIAADLAALGQLVPREPVTFELVSLAEAATAYRSLIAMLDAAVGRACENPA